MVSVVRCVRFPALLVVLCLLGACGTLKSIDDAMKGVDSGPKPPFKWDPDYSTPGSSLKLEELDRVNSADGTEVHFALHVTGFLPEESVTLWMNSLTLYSTITMTVGDDGILREKDATNFRGISLIIHGHVPGSALDLAVVTGDKRAQAKIIPFPIEAEQGGCRASVELVDYRGLKFLLTFNGFEANEDVTLAIQYQERPPRIKTVKASNSGEVRHPVTYSAGNHGKARATATGRDCAVTVGYSVGKDAFAPGQAINGSGEPNLSAAVPGTAADSGLQRDITQRLFAEASKYHKECEHRVLKAEGYEAAERSVIASEMGGEAAEREQGLRAKDQMLVEKWFVKSCETVNMYEVLLLRSETGTDIMVKKLESLK